MSEPDTDVLVSTQHRPDRAAHESIRGYVHQATLTALEWVRTGETDILVCEGNEDVDRLIYDEDGTFCEISERQIKAIGGNVTARTPAVHESIFNFLRSFHVHDLEGVRSRFTFSTTATKTKQRTNRNPKTALETTDVLERWSARHSDQSKDDELISAIKALADRYLAEPASPASDAEPGDGAEEDATSENPTKAKQAHAARVRDAFAYLEGGPPRWTRFLDSVQWSFDEPSLDELQGQLVLMLASAPRSQALPSELLSQRLVARVLSVSSKANVNERTLTRANLDLLVRDSASELQAWAERTHAAAFFARVLEQETRIARIEKQISVESGQRRALQGILDRLDDTAAQKSHFQSMWQRYFKSRVIDGLFVPPPDFNATVDEFCAKADFVETARRSFEAETAPIDTLASAFPKLDAARAALRLCALARPKQDMHGDLAEWEASLLQRLRDVERETRPLERSLHGNEASKSDRYMPALENRDWISEVQGTFYELRRFRAPIWVSVAQVGRGKSNFAWELATLLSSRGEAVALLTGRDIQPNASLESVVRSGLALDQAKSNFVLEALDKRYADGRRPLFIVIDAINEVLCKPQEAVETLKRIMDEVITRGGVRLFMTCRDVFWRYQYESEFELFEQHVELLKQEKVVPTLGDDALTRNLDHFTVQNILPSDLIGDYWRDNPLLLRLFCEAWEGERYDGKKPIEFRSFPIMESFIRRKSSELKQRGFGVVELEDELDRLAAVFVDAGADSDGIGRTLALAQARDALEVKSATGERLFDALMDMEVILRLEPVSPTETHVCFALERVEEFLVARWVLRNLTRWEDDVLADLISAKKLTISAMGTAIAMALYARRITNPAALKRSLAKTMDTLFDLLEGDQIAELRPTLSEAATEPDGIETLSWALKTQLEIDTSAVRPFIESLAFEILGAAVLRLSVIDRHVRFFGQIDLVNALADRVRTEIEVMRQWALSGFASFPSGVEVSIHRQEAVVALLGANSPQVRDLAHEWVFWTGRFRPAETIELLGRLAGDTDFLLRERIAALRYSLLHRHTSLATEVTLRSIYDAAYRDPPNLRHYLLVEFARKTLLEHWATSQKVLSAAECALVETPPRVPSPPGGRSYGQTQWTARPPILSDMSRYTFGSRFRKFHVRDKDKAVRDTLDLLPELGYSADMYQEVDDELGSQSNPRHWGGQGRRFERFGKTWANVASFIVLQRWAETTSGEGKVSDLQRCFAYQSPNYDYLFTLERRDLNSALPMPLRIPESWSTDTWDAVDERGLLTQLLGNFPEEVCVSLQAGALTPGLEFHVLRDGVIADSAVLDAWRFANESRPSTDGRYPEPDLDEIDDNFDFHLLANVDRSPPAVEDKILHICHEYVRTLNSEDRVVLTITPRIALTGKLRQTEVSGEFADETGAIVVRRISWRGDNNHGSAVLIRRDVLDHICAELRVELAFDDYAELQGRTAEGQWDEKQFPRRWRLTFTTEREVSEEVLVRTNTWQKAHGLLDTDERFRCHYFWSIGDEVGLEIALCMAEHTRAIRARDEKLERTLERHIEKLKQRLRGAD